LKTSTKNNKGILEFAKILEKLITQRQKTKKEREMQRLESEIKDIILNNIKEKIDLMSDNKTFTKYLKMTQLKKLSPNEAADKISKSILK